MKPEPHQWPPNPRPSTRGLLRAGLLLLLLGTFGVGCRQETKVPEARDIAGTYTLISIDGHELPYTPAHENGALSVKAGSFTIRADGTCRSKVTFVPPTGVESSIEVSATYTRDGSKLTLQWKGAGTTVGTVEGSAFTMNNEGMVFAYRKQAGPDPR